MRHASGKPARVSPQLGADVSLPVFGMESTVYYGHDAQQLVALESRSVPQESLQVSGAVSLSTDAAAAVVNDLLGPERVEPSELTTRPGIFVVDGRPDAGRVTYRVQVPAGAGRVPIDVYVDGETRQVLQVE